ncbi:MAG TPA: P-II family nitrogen regulator [Sporomusaceae bacterium]|jgi:nitrogen regulatory protein PII 1|uniref:Nitrogen regulatory protein P-II family n=1 Tax=Anaerospora hongkongensis TaxID=244830 RepID=A0A4R1Q0X4_9FIRM|nr:MULTISPECIES: P-II family nitrogen regulator [Anaerospora]TCL37774.1 nitrogen regulatory protein P-II family [Anaerospora hongkongensis]HAK75063.1 P-II family nitrogen regulator [Sporomusaceae bacterium]
MFLVRAMVRPDKADEVIYELSRAGFHAVTKIDVVGRGKQKGIRIGDIVYDEIPKTLLFMVVDEEKDKEDVISIVLKTAKTGEKGAFGDGKIFVSVVEEAYTISSGASSL